MKLVRNSFFLFLVCTCLLSCEQNKRNKLPGYIQGKFIYLSAYYNGILNKIAVVPGQFIEKGQPLFIMEPYPQNTALMAANAQVKQAMDEKNKREANYLFEKANNERNKILFKKGVISKEEFEKSTDSYNSALANKKSASASLIAEQANQKQATWDVQQKEVLSPVDALVFDTYYSEHEKVMEGKPILSLLIPGLTKIIFFIPEKSLSAIQVNQVVDVFIDGNSEAIKAKISYISAKEEYTPPVIFSDMERQKFVFRVEALPLRNDKHLILHPGQPVTIGLNMQSSKRAQ